MGLEKNSHAVFLSISDGKICKAVKSPTQDSITRTNKNSRVVHEEFFDSIKGTLTDIFTKDHAEFGKKWVVRLEDDGITYQLEFNYSSGYSQAFLKTLPNVDLSSAVKLTPKLSVEGDKKKTTLFVNQHGVALKHYYTKDNPNGIPELQKIKVKGKQTYDDSDIMQFLEDMVKSEILPKIKKTAPAPVTADDIDEKDEAPF